MKNDPRYVCHHRMSLVNKQTSSPLKIFKQESVRFLSNADDNCQVWLVSDGTGFQDLACPRGISAIYFMTFHYNINVLGDRFYVLHSCPQGKNLLIRSQPPSLHLLTPAIAYIAIFTFFLKICNQIISIPNIVSFIFTCLLLSKDEEF